MDDLARDGGADPAPTHEQAPTHELGDGALCLVYEAGDCAGLIVRRIEAGELGELDGQVRLLPRPGSGSARPPEVAPS